MKVILVIEDNADFRSIVKAALFNAGYQPIITSSRDEALKVLAGIKPQAIIVDWAMPGMSLESFKQSTGKLDIPCIILMSGDLGVDQKAMQLEFPYSLQKPFEIEDLLAVVEKCCGPAS